MPATRYRADPSMHRRPMHPQARRRPRSARSRPTPPAPRPTAARQPTTRPEPIPASPSPDAPRRRQLRLTEPGPCRTSPGVRCRTSPGTGQPEHSVLREDFPYWLKRRLRRRRAAGPRAPALRASAHPTALRPASCAKQRKAPEPKTMRQSCGRVIRSGPPPSHSRRPALPTPRPSRLPTCCRSPRR